MTKKLYTEEYVNNGEVLVNGVVATLQTSIEEGDVVTIHGNVIEPKQEHIVLLFNKYHYII